MYKVKYDKNRNSFGYLVINSKGNIFAATKTKGAADSYVKLLNIYFK